MRRSIKLMVVPLLLWSVVCAAHTHLISSVPANHAELSAAPKEASLSFAAAVVVTSATLIKPDDTQLALTPLPDGAVKAAHFTLPTLTAGHYRLQWRAQSADGHRMAGEISFVVNGPAPKP